MSKGIVSLLGQFALQCKDESAGRDLNFLAVMLSQWCKGSLAERINLLNHRPEQPRDDVGSITLCSAHASKGLEFEHVTIINANSGNWPHDKTDLGFFEEQRLFYVASTRAKDKLTIALPHSDDEVKGGVTVFVNPLIAEAARQQRTDGMAAQAAPVQADLLESINA
jgi:superfamily I DNA/RNA helicase